MQTGALHERRFAIMKLYKLSNLNMEQANVAVSGATLQKLDSIKKLIGDTWRSYKERFSVYGEIILFPAVITAVGNMMIAQRNLVVVAALGGLVSLIGFIAFIFGGIALLLAVIKGTDVKESYRQSVALFWPFVWVSILGVVVTIGGFIMLIVPGIMMGIWFLFSRYLVITEGRRGLDALVQSREYARGYWFALFGRMLLMGIVIAVLSAIVSGLLTLLITVTAGAIFAPIVNILIWVFVVPFSVIYLYVIYKNVVALKPHLAAAPVSTSRGFLKASGIVGVVGIVLIPIIIIVLVGSAIFLKANYKHLPPGAFVPPTGEVSGSAY